jgi:hypothetical protein
MMVRNFLFLCGILSSLLYIATDILGAMRFEGYSYTSQTVSELSAIGAQSRPLVVPLFLAYSALVIAFGLGVWGSANGKRVLGAVGGLSRRLLCQMDYRASRTRVISGNQHWSLG